MQTIVGLAIAGAAGTLVRYGVDGAVSRRFGGFPFGTLVVNLTGTFLLGLAVTVLADRTAVAPWLRASVAVGFLGAYTTFSTLSFESYRLLEDGSPGLAFLNAFGSVAAGMVAVYAGIVVGRAV